MKLRIYIESMYYEDICRAIEEFLTEAGTEHFIDASIGVSKDPLPYTYYGCICYGSMREEDTYDPDVEEIINIAKDLSAANGLHYTAVFRLYSDDGICEQLYSG